MNLKYMQLIVFLSIDLDIKENNIQINEKESKNIKKTKYNSHHIGIIMNLQSKIRHWRKSSIENKFKYIFKNLTFLYLFYTLVIIIMM